MGKVTVDKIKADYAQRVKIYNDCETAKQHTASYLGLSLECVESAIKSQEGSYTPIPIVGRTGPRPGY